MVSICVSIDSLITNLPDWTVLLRSAHILSGVPRVDIPISTLLSILPPPLPSQGLKLQGLNVNPEPSPLAYTASTISSPVRRRGLHSGSMG
jgi:hypothetical protein